MMAWSGRTADGRFGLIVEVGALSALDDMCSVADNIETGGVLIGQYSLDLRTAIVVEASPPPVDSRQGTHWFERGVTGLREMLRRRWRSSERRYYLGEWHFHPTSFVVPSTIDLVQMHNIRRSQQYRCVHPIMLIAGRVRQDNGRDFRAFVFSEDDDPLEFVHAHLK